MIISDADLIEQGENNKPIELWWHSGRFASIYPSKGCYVHQDSLEDNMFVDIEFLNKTKEECTELAQKDFNKFTTQLKRNGIQVEVFNQETDSPDSVCTDWFMTIRNETFPNGVLVLGAMKNRERRKERSQDIIDVLSNYYEDVIDLVDFQDEDLALELQGSLVWDWKNSKIYWSLSQRSDKEVFEYLIEELNTISQYHTGKIIKGITFCSYDFDDNQIYHTDIMMAILDKHVIICTDMIKDESQRQIIISELTSPELNVHVRELIKISEEEWLNMWANVVFAIDKNKNSCIIMSERAEVNYHRENIKLLKKNYKIIKTDLGMLERISGASAKSLLSAIQ